jgi:PAS domain S-box-containing protein
MLQLRKSGIDVLGEVAWGTHVCNFYETKQDLLDILVPYFKAGLTNNEYCLLVLSVTTDRVTPEEAADVLRSAIPDLDRYISTGQLEMVNSEGWFLTDGAYNLTEVIRRFVHKLEQALAKGYDGMRINGGSDWLMGKERELHRFEKKLNDLIAGQRMIVLCNFPLQATSGEDVFDMAQVHRFTMARRKGIWEVVESGAGQEALAELRQLNQKVGTGMPANNRQVFFGYLVVVVSIGLAMSIGMLLQSYQISAPASLFFCALMFSAWYGGLRPGLLAVVLSLLAFDYFFTAPVYSLMIITSELPRMVLFALAGLFVVLLSANQRSTAQSLRHARDVLQETVQKLQRTNAVLQTEVGERIRSEQLIITEKQLSNEIIDSIPGVFLVLDENFKALRWNKNAEMVSGYTAPEVAQLNALTDFYPDPVERNKVRQLFEMAFRTGNAQGEVSPVKDGTQTSFYFTARLIDYESKPAIICTAIDITELKQAQEKLNATEQRFRAIVENTPDQIVQFDRQLRRTYVNPAVVRSLGKTAEVLLEKPLGSVIREMGLDVRESELDQMRRGITDVFATGETSTVEMSLPFPSGRRYFSVGFFPERDVHGSVIHVMAIAHDITERKQAEDTLRQNEDRIRLVIDTIPIMAWSIRQDGGLDFANRRWLEYAGLSLEEEIEEPTQIIHPDDREKVIATWTANMAGGEFYEDEMRLRRADGEYRKFLIRTAPFRDGQGEVVKWYGVAIDIEDSKRAENALRESYAQIRQLTEHLQTVREKERTYIAREIHDELGQQLTAIKMDVVWIDRRTPESLADIKTKLKNIIGLLDGSNQSVRKILSELRPRILDDQGLLEGIEWLSRQFSEITSVPVKFSVSEKDINVPEPLAICIFRVCQEAFTNITRYSQAENVTISLFLADDRLSLLIEDDGIGFDVATVNAGKSFGILGMRERVFALNGKFDLNSSPGHGTKISVMLPLKSDNPQGSAATYNPLSQ